MKIPNFSSDNKTSKPAKGYCLVRRLSWKLHLSSSWYIWSFSKCHVSILMGGVLQGLVILPHNLSLDTNFLVLALIRSRTQRNMMVQINEPWTFTYFMKARKLYWKLAHKKMVKLRRKRCSRKFFVLLQQLQNTSRNEIANATFSKKRGSNWMRPEW